MATSRTVVSPLSTEVSPRRRNIFVIGVGLAVGAFLLTFLLGSVLLTRAEISGGVNVVVANTDIAPRQSLTPDMVSVVSYPSKLVPAGAVTTVGGAVGKFPLVAIAKNQPLTTGLLAASSELVTPATNQYLPIPHGYIALTIPTSELEGVAGYIAAGDYIDVIATVNTATFGQQNSKQVAKTVFTNLHVIRVGPQSASKDSTAAGVSSSLTVVLNSCDAEMLNWLVGNASLKYELRSYKDYAPAATAPDPACPNAGGSAGIGPSSVDARFGFTKI